MFAHQRQTSARSRHTNVHDAPLQRHALCVEAEHNGGWRRTRQLSRSSQGLEINLGPRLAPAGWNSSRAIFAESEKENKCMCARVCECALSLYRDLTLELEHRPVREGVLGQVQVGEVGTAAPQQGPEQLAEKQRKGKPMRLCCVVLCFVMCVVLCNSNLHSSNIQEAKLKTDTDAGRREKVAKNEANLLLAGKDSRMKMFVNTTCKTMSICLAGL